MISQFSRLLITIFLFSLLSLSSLRAEEKKFVVVTPEKTGTHLLTKLLENLTDKKTRNCWAHTLTEEQLLAELDAAQNEQAFLQVHALPTDVIIKTLAKNGYKVVFLMRDPRDVTISMLFYIDKGWTYGPYRQDSPYMNLSFDDKLYEMITGSKFRLSIPRSVIGRRLPWMSQSSKFVYTAYFENLVGPDGGGTKPAQYQEIQKIANFLGLAKNKKELLLIAKNLFGTPGEKTFREGQIGSWRQHFKPVHIEAFKRYFGHELIYLGYEENSNW